MFTNIYKYQSINQEALVPLLRTSDKNVLNFCEVHA